ncbi:MAG: hypothetical protein JJ974_09895 [Phycisphaerales bacterium]|nr:hypothetical protein [Phycisphaerales bacterium]
MQIGGPDAQPKTWTEAQVNQALDHMAAIETTQNTIMNGLALVELDTNELQQYATKTYDYQLYMLLMFCIFFGYHIGHYFLPKVKQIGGPG